jgi:hypothetical protein
MKEVRREDLTDEQWVQLCAAAGCEEDIEEYLNDPRTVLEDE